MPSTGELEILLAASCYVNQDKLRPDGPIGSYADLTYDQKAMLYIMKKMKRTFRGWN